MANGMAARPRAGAESAQMITEMGWLTGFGHKKTRRRRVFLAAESLNSDDVGCGRATLAVLDGKLNLLAFRQSFETIADDCGEMHENVLGTISRGDKTETFAFVKPFNVTSDLAHLSFLT
jgi:hypothetical protein